MASSRTEETFYGVHNDIKMKKNNNLQKQLGLFLDENGLLRCRGRLGNASLTEGARFPILLPKNDRLTYLIIDQSHKQILHNWDITNVKSGTSEMLDFTWSSNRQSCTEKLHHLSLT